MMPRRVLTFVLVLGAVSFCAGFNDPPDNSSGRRKFSLSDRRPPTTQQQQNESSKSIASYMAVDPSHILSTLVRNAGFFLDPKLKQVATLLHCDQAKLNLATRDLLITNVTVSLPNSVIDALRIGLIHISWDSYRKPCLDIQVENVDITVEFLNLLLTRNNWDELREKGFPPAFLYLEDTSDTDTPSSSYVFVRIGSIDLTGKVVLHTRSRPLKQPIADDLVFRLDTIKDLNTRIRSLAAQNEKKAGRRGCTSDEIYETYQSFFSEKVKLIIRRTVEDIMAGKLDLSPESNLVNESKKVASTARAALLRYKDGVESISREFVKERLLVQVEDDEFVKISDGDIDKILSDGVDTLKTSLKALGASAVNKLSNLREMRQNATKVESNDEIRFPDW